ncbi:hypothetical protein FIBSPDRAFT_868900 [Athelia psychrophila]|uniref:Uncharacterized protein n=1 Tax=Athelia psychrophila TaxID=1759441 RepID=A0A166CQF0_9AGAM|nr:hypothetical protein FIBSPDRAFT_868900 [Fibularhizoctonia sp. CBS 109695]
MNSRLRLLPVPPTLIRCSRRERSTVLMPSGSATDANCCGQQQPHGADSHFFESMLPDQTDIEYELLRSHTPSSRVGTTLFTTSPSSNSIYTFPLSSLIATISESSASTKPDPPDSCKCYLQFTSSPLTAIAVVDRRYP